MPKTNPDVTNFINTSKAWQKELKALRAILLGCPVVEEFKWRAPCYTHEGRNIAILASLKACCTIGFFKGALLKDPQGILTTPGENTRSARTVRFTSTAEINRLKSVLTTYVHEAIEIEARGHKVAPASETPLELPAELEAKLSESPALRAAFDALTPGRQRGYVLFINAAKQSTTRSKRVEQHRERILSGKGIHDCICGHSKKMPTCDGSHNKLK